MLLKHQRRLGLSATATVVLRNLARHRWFPERHLCPRSTMIARRMGGNARTVQRTLNRLTELGLIERVRDGSNRDADCLSTVIRLTGLVGELDALCLNSSRTASKES